MILLIETGQYSDITVRSAEENCSKDVTILVVDSVESYLASVDRSRTPVFLIRGDDSVKLVTSNFEEMLKSEIETLIYYKLGKKFPGAYLKGSNSKAYIAAGYSDYATTFDYDVMLVDPSQYSLARDTSTVELKKQLKVELLPLYLNFKDDPVVLDITEPWSMLTCNVRSCVHAGVINMSLSMICKDDVDSAVMFPFELLNKYTIDSNHPIRDIVYKKTELSNRLFGKIKQEMIKELCQTKIS
jgi:hypothetical protein